MNLPDRDRPTLLEQRLGYQFRDPALLVRALTHSSQKHESGGVLPDNETLEFFGDAILSMLVAERLFELHPKRPEGDLSRLRARLVRAQSLARRARALELGAELLLGRGEILGQGRDKTSILSDAFEALVAAIYLDGGLEAARRFVLLQLDEAFGQAADATEPTDFKSSLQVLTQKQFGCVPQYRVISEEGPAHKRRFQVEVSIQDQSRGMAWGNSKKQAEQEAARLCWNELQKSFPAPNS